MRILSTSELFENKEYFAKLSSKGKVKKIRLLGVVNSYSTPEICFQVINPKKNYNESINYFGINEIGIGNNTKEAVDSYGKIIDSQLKPNYYSDEEIEAFLNKIETAPNKFEYYNFKNVKSI